MLKMLNEIHKSNELQRSTLVQHQPSFHRCWIQPVEARGRTGVVGRRGGRAGEDSAGARVMGEIGGKGGKENLVRKILVNAVKLQTDYMAVTGAAEWFGSCACHNYPPKCSFSI